MVKFWFIWSICAQNYIKISNFYNITIILQQSFIGKEKELTRLHYTITI